MEGDYEQSPGSASVSEDSVEVKVRPVAMPNDRRNKRKSSEPRRLRENGPGKSPKIAKTHQNFTWNSASEDSETGSDTGSLLSAETSGDAITFKREVATPIADLSYSSQNGVSEEQESELKFNFINQKCTITSGRFFSGVNFQNSGNYNHNENDCKPMDLRDKNFNLEHSSKPNVRLWNPALSIDKNNKKTDTRSNNKINNNKVKNLINKNPSFSNNNSYIVNYFSDSNNNEKGYKIPLCSTPVSNNNKKRKNYSKEPNFHMLYSSTETLNSPDNSPGCSAVNNKICRESKDTSSSSRELDISQRNYKNMTRERRVEANARERTRVHTISAAFENLRRAVPSYSHNQKLSKLAILKIACNYIMALASLNDQDYSCEQDNPSFSECVDLCTRTIQQEGRARRKKD